MTTSPDPAPNDGSQIDLTQIGPATNAALKHLQLYVASAPVILSVKGNSRPRRLAGQALKLSGWRGEFEGSELVLGFWLRV